jgi:NADPH2:quinone reductase
VGCLILCQWLSHLGANVIGTCVGQEKAKISKNMVVLISGCRKSRFSGCHQAASDGKGVSVVPELSARKLLKIVGLRTALRPDRIVRLGIRRRCSNRSRYLRNKGSLFITRPTISHYVAESAGFQRGASAFALIGSGDCAFALTISIR